MADELNDILSFNPDGISREQLMKYLNGELSSEEQHKVEKAMIDSGMINDAVEGLQYIRDKSKLSAIQQELDTHLSQYLQKRKIRNGKKNIFGLSWIIIIIVIVLLLILAGFAVVFLEKGGI